MLSRLHISTDRHCLVQDDGHPLFWLADTAWDLFNRLTLAEAEEYLTARHNQEFTAIMAVVLAENADLANVNELGMLALHENDPLRTDTEYFAHVDAIIERAAAHDLYVGLLPTWGSHVWPHWSPTLPAIFDPTNAYAYARWLAQRYEQCRHIVWIIGGDRSLVDEVNDRDYMPVWGAMAAGIRSVMGDRALLAFHPTGQHGTSQWLPDAPWLDLHGWQSGHLRPDWPIWDAIAGDYAARPRRPTLDLEPNYEDHPIDPFTRSWDASYGYFRDHDVRKQAYRAVFAGACGHTYGHHSIWQFAQAGRPPINFPWCDWRAALQRPGANHMRHLRRLIASRPMLRRIPAPDMILTPQEDPATHAVACRDRRGSYAFVYCPAAAQTLDLALTMLTGATLRLWWYDPRTGAAQDGGTITRGDRLTITTLSAGPDWILVLDDNAMNVPPPGMSAPAN